MNNFFSMKRPILISCLSGVLLLPACMVGPDFKGAPPQDLPASWATAVPPAVDKDALTHWWQLFGDNQLESLLEQAVNNNPDMVAAALRIKEAESSARIAGAALLPSANASGSQSTAPSSGFSSTSHGKWGLGASASWELDIFGGNRRSIEAALANLRSTEASAAAVRTALLANVASAYFDWIAAEEQLRIAKEQLDYQQHTYEIVVQRQSVGFAADLDLEQAKAQIASTKSTIPAMEAARQNARNQLAIYLGSYLDRVKLSMPSADVYNKIPSVPTGLPSDLLRRRPDIIQAEEDLHAATANVGVAVADLFPKFSLTGSVNTSSGSDFAGMFSSGKSSWALGGGVNQSIFQGGALWERVRQQKTATQRSAESYRKTVVVAMSEVESCLINYAQVMQQLPLYEEARRANREAARISLKLYTAGMTDFLNVASAQQSWLSSEERLVSARQSLRQNMANLYKVLGGGWDASRVQALSKR